MLTLDHVFGISAWKLIGPLCLILLGIWVFWQGRSGGHVETPPAQKVIPLEGARRARIQIDHGGGRLRLDASTDYEELVAGTFGRGVQVRRSPWGDGAELRLKPAEGSFGPFVWLGRNSGSNDWDLGLNNHIPLSLAIHCGARANEFDLEGLRVVDLRLETGASSTELILPAEAGETRVAIAAGMASVRIHVPSGVAARIHTSAGLAGVSVDTGRFPRVGEHRYESPDFGAAANRADIDIEAGMGSIQID